ncbi:TauD/TfdA dioxygenase family protein [Nostoc sphaeroides]|uniref:TauD, taurine dioxygenase n=1 Tax=Nostoc sphaeroides CCNUC1 TaxID=2653204 RepID=A0A5P8VSA2_9NOSO|nr:TauD/TfdA family dioxygenase [Nostoc sphaeroides]MCC5628085.1 TauD/TfdA family dioxygenase [Nostoc sphaeroides CHAB 2801]QFS43207.1 tauD, taurine dioxygenase [Nostoc sphaeroides CCNUC1]
MTPITKHQSRLGVEVLRGCNLSSLTNLESRELKESLWKHGVVVVRQQQLTAQQLKEFAKETFGDFMFGGPPKTLDPDISPDLQSQYVYILGNPKGLFPDTAQKYAWQWHHDKDGLPRTEGLDMNALYVVMLYGIEVPEGENGQPHTTEFLDMIEAYNNLDHQHQQQLEQMSMYHSPPMFSKNPDVDTDIPRKVHPIVSTHKVTGKKGLYLGSDTAIAVGMEDRPEEAKRFWQDLFATVLECTPIYSHVWQPGDIIFWDNSQVMHRGRPYDATKYKRIALRLGVVDKG